MSTHALLVPHPSIFIQASRLVSLVLRIVQTVQMPQPAILVMMGTLSPLNSIAFYSVLLYVKLAITLAPVKFALMELTWILNPKIVSFVQLTAHLVLALLSVPVVDQGLFSWLVLAFLTKPLYLVQQAVKAAHEMESVSNANLDTSWMTP